MGTLAAVGASAVSVCSRDCSPPFGMHVAVWSVTGVTLVVCKDTAEGLALSMCLAEGVCGV